MENLPPEVESLDQVVRIISETRDELVPQFIPAGGELSSTFLLVFLHSMIYLVRFATLVMVVLDRLKMLVKGATFTQWLKGITVAAFMGLAVKLALLKPLGNN